MGQNINFKTATVFVSILAVFFWWVILTCKGIAAPFSWDCVKEIPAAGGYVGTFAVLFAKWGWRIPVFRGWLVLIPDLNGTWKGEIRSTWIEPDSDQALPAIEAYLVIRQSLFKISCVLLSNESRSISRAASVLVDLDHQLKVLEFTYSNSPRVSVQHRSNAHDGAAVLDILSQKEWRMSGKYWTDRSPLATKGEMDFKFLSRRARESFA